MQSPAARRGFLLRIVGVDLRSTRGRMWASAPTNNLATCSVGVDALIDPTAKRPCSRRAFAENFPLVFSLQLGKIAVK